MEPIEELAAKVSAIAAVAQTGLAWSEQLYERERYGRILELAAEMANILTGEVELPSNLLANQLKEGWMALVTPGVAGYVTPKISTGAMCFDSEGRLLLGKRSDNGNWFMPTGWQEVGLTPAQNVVKEVKEETGIDCRPLRLIAVRDTRLQRSSNPAIHNIALTFLCEALTTEINLHPLETLEAGFFTEPEATQIVPSRVLPLIEQAFAAWRGELNETYFDHFTV
ncbi:MAG: NUDIX hydrolase N-terminal domain-containing protein [Chloroflexi bacterium]|nr:NUDIX hydrolase N-terminal domain-containing protein [Chloroflexota bacterium]